MDLSKPAVRRLVSFDRTCDSGSQSRSNSRGRASQVIAKPLVTINGVVSRNPGRRPLRPNRSTLRDYSLLMREIGSGWGPCRVCYLAGTMRFSSSNQFERRSNLRRPRSTRPALRPMRAPDRRICRQAGCERTRLSGASVSGDFCGETRYIAECDARLCRRWNDNESAVDHSRDEDQFGSFGTPNRMKVEGLSRQLIACRGSRERLDIDASVGRQRPTRNGGRRGRAVGDPAAIRREDRPDGFDRFNTSKRRKLLVVDRDDPQRKDGAFLLGKRNVSAIR